MVCPHCNDELDVVHCPHCCATLNMRDVERIGQLAYLRDRLEAWAYEGLLPRDAARRALATTETELAALRPPLGRLPSSVPVPARSAPATTGTGRAPGRVGARPGLPFPVRRPLNWQQIGLSLLSERTLNTLLLVGALLILASASVISTLNPTHLGPATHLGTMVATTLAFFLSSSVLRDRFGLVRTARTLWPRWAIAWACPSGRAVGRSAT